jgi:hypothetical protein
MCYITRNVFTVCAHSRVGELVECKEQIARNRKYQEGGCWASVQLALLSCRPAEKLGLEYSFCDHCRNQYRGYDTTKVDAILNYWAFKNRRGYCFSVPPSLVPADYVFGMPASSDLVDAKQPRCELIAIDKALPRRPLETPAKWLRRLEQVRTLTLKQAELRDTAYYYNVIRRQPRITSPMSIDPYARDLSPVPELSESQATTTPHDSLNPYDTTMSPQLHLATLQKLCGGETPREFTVGPSGEASGLTTDNAQEQKPTARRLPESLPPGHEQFLQEDTGPTTPGYVGSTLPVPPPSRRLTTQPCHRQHSDSEQDITEPATQSQEAGDPVVTAVAEAVQSPADVEGNHQLHQTDPIFEAVGKLTSISLDEHPVQQRQPEHPPNLTSHFSWDSSVADPIDIAIAETMDESTGVVEQSSDTEPNMTSRFSVSDVDPDDAAEMAGLGPVSPVSEVFCLDDDVESLRSAAGGGRSSPVEGECQVP